MDISKVEDRRRALSRGREARRALSPGIQHPDQRGRLQEVAQGYLKLGGFFFVTNAAVEESALIVQGCDTRACLRACAGLSLENRASPHVGGLACIESCLFTTVMKTGLKEAEHGTSRDLG